MEDETAEELMYQLKEGTEAMEMNLASSYSDQLSPSSMEFLHQQVRHIHTRLIRRINLNRATERTLTPPVPSELSPSLNASRTSRAIPFKDERRSLQSLRDDHVDEHGSNSSPPHTYPGGQEETDHLDGTQTLVLNYQYDQVWNQPIISPRTQQRRELQHQVEQERDRAAMKIQQWWRRLHRTYQRTHQRRTAIIHHAVHLLRPLFRRWHLRVEAQHFRQKQLKRGAWLSWLRYINTTYLRRRHAFRVLYHAAGSMYYWYAFQMWYRYTRFQHTVHENAPYPVFRQSLPLWDDYVRQWESRWAWEHHIEDRFRRDRALPYLHAWREHTRTIALINKGVQQARPRLQALWRRQIIHRWRTYLTEMRAVRRCFQALRELWMRGQWMRQQRTERRDAVLQKAWRIWHKVWPRQKLINHGAMLALTRNRHRVIRCLLIIRQDHDRSVFVKCWKGWVYYLRRRRAWRVFVSYIVHQQQRSLRAMVLRHALRRMDGALPVSLNDDQIQYAQRCAAPYGNTSTDACYSWGDNDKDTVSWSRDTVRRWHRHMTREPFRAALRLYTIQQRHAAYRSMMEEPPHTAQLPPSHPRVQARIDHAALVHGERLQREFPSRTGTVDETRKGMEGDDAGREADERWNRAAEVTTTEDYHIFNSQIRWTAVMREETEGGDTGSTDLQNWMKWTQRILLLHHAKQSALSLHQVLPSFSVAEEDIPSLPPSTANSKDSNPYLYHRRPVHRRPRSKTRLRRHRSLGEGHIDRKLRVRKGEQSGRYSHTHADTDADTAQDDDSDEPPEWIDMEHPLSSASLSSSLSGCSSSSSSDAEEEGSLKTRTSFHSDHSSNTSDGAYDDAGDKSIKDRKKRRRRRPRRKRREYSSNDSNSSISVLTESSSEEESNEDTPGRRVRMEHPAVARGHWRTAGIWSSWQRRQDYLSSPAMVEDQGSVPEERADLQHERNQEDNKKTENRKEMKTRNRNNTKTKKKKPQDQWSWADALVSRDGKDEHGHQDGMNKGLERSESDSWLLDMEMDDENEDQDDNNKYKDMSTFIREGSLFSVHTTASGKCIFSVPLHTDPEDQHTHHRITSLSTDLYRERKRREGSNPKLKRKRQQFFQDQLPPKPRSSASSLPFRNSHNSTREIQNSGKRTPPPLHYHQTLHHQRHPQQHAPDSPSRMFNSSGTQQNYHHHRHYRRRQIEHNQLPRHNHDTGKTTHRGHTRTPTMPNPSTSPEPGDDEHTTVSQINLSSSTPKPTSTSTQPFSDIHNDAFIMRKAPRSWRPYIKLMRADRPAGTYLLMLPCFWGMGMGLASPLPPLGLSLLFATGAFVMRGAGCVINDLWDREYDRRVERTQGRPLASGELQVRHAMGLLAGQLGLGLMVLLSFNSYTVATVGAASLGLVVVYPLAKRVTYWPQIVLGLTFNWGVLVGYAAATGSMDAMVVAPLYMAAAAFTLVYDTIYAHQDKKDDITAGVKSTALLFGSQTSSWLLLFCLLFFAGLLISGWNAGQSGPYFGGITVASAVLVYFSLFTDFDNPDQCLKRFRHSRWISVLVMLAVYAGNAGGRRSGVPGHGTPRPDPNLE